MGDSSAQIKGQDLDCVALVEDVAVVGHDGSDVVVHCADGCCYLATGSGFDGSELD